MTVNTNFKTYEDVYLCTSNYCADNSIYVCIMNDEDGQLAVLTKCLDDKHLNGNENYIDINNCPWAPQFLMDYGLAEPTGEYRFSGYCEYPVFRFNVDEVKKYTRE